MLKRMRQAAETPTTQRATDPKEWSALMVLALAGDAAAYRRLLLGITPYLRAIASRAHRNTSDAEDTVQDILLTLHSVRQTYDPSRPFKPWLAGIAQHRVVDRLRAQGRISAREVILEMAYETFAAPDTNADLALDQRAMQAGLRALPDGQRQAVTMLKLEEMSLKQAAEVSGMSIAALKVSTHRGIKALRRLLGQEGSEK
jgi:RNA polymerase sigma-70 factor (ECF subfamily)